jgi:rhomboid family GlyGly-CTERM serine protease
VRFRLPYITLAIAALAAIATAAAPGALDYQRQLIHSGEVWRIVTCHLAHFPGEHFGWCMVALLVLGIGCETLDRPAFLATTLFSAVSIPLALAMFAPGLRDYRGLSGIESAWFVLLLVELLQRKAEERAWLGVAAAAALGVAFVAKIALEMRGVTMFVSNPSRQFQPVPLAHLLGVISCACIMLARRSRSSGGSQPRAAPIG